jgi:uncharacterized membrane protein YraQ (UPF0718 family)
VILWHGLRGALLMAYEVWWALVLGFAVSAIVQAWVPRERIERALAGRGPRPVALASALSAASSSCSYAAVAIAKSLFAKGASAASSLAFQFASTNLVWELAFVLWALIGWQFALAEYLGGLLMIVLMTLVLRVFVSPALEREARQQPGVRRPAINTTPRRSAGRSAHACTAPTRGLMSRTTFAPTGRCSGARSRSACCLPGSPPRSRTPPSRAPS